MRSSFSAVAAAVMALSSATFVASLGAQAPVITPKGDPSVKSDTIYKLAVDPAKYPDDNVVYLLDDGVIHLDAQGRGTRTFREVIQVLKDDAVEELSEQSFSYSPGHEKLTVNWIRVVKPDGTVISNAPAHVQDADVPAEMGDPVYSDSKVKRMSLTGVAPGTIIDYSVTTEELKPYLPGDFLESWSFMAGAPVLRSRYIVDVPSSVMPHILERNLNFARTTQTVKGRTVYTWATQNIPEIKAEHFAADSNGVFMHVSVGAPTTWGNVANWYAGNARSRYVVSPVLAAKISQVVIGAKTLDDSIRAVHRWVAQDIRYVSIALGMGGYQPRMPDTVFKTGFGDCKDKATLFIAAMQQLGVTAYPVLLNSSEKVERLLPSFTQFDHVIAAVKTASGYQFVDLTADLVPYGAIPGNDQGQFGVVVLPNGKSEEVTLPEDGITVNRDSTVITGTMDTTGEFNGRYFEQVHGVLAEVFRGLFKEAPDSSSKAAFAKTVAARYFDGAVGDSLVAFDGKDLSATPMFSVRITHARAATEAGGTLILSIPKGLSALANRVADDLDAAPPRLLPIDAEKVMGPIMGRTEIDITLPKGWTAKLPETVNVTGPFGTYRSEYTQVGDVLKIVRMTQGERGIFPPDRVKELSAFFRAIGKDDVKFVVLEK